MLVGGKHAVAEEIATPKCDRFFEKIAFKSLN